MLRPMCPLTHRLKCCGTGDEEFEYLMSNYTEILNMQQFWLINVLFTGVAKVSEHWTSPP